MSHPNIQPPLRWQRSLRSRVLSVASAPKSASPNLSIWISIRIGQSINGRELAAYRKTCVSACACSSSSRECGAGRVSSVASAASEAWTLGFDLRCSRRWAVEWLTRFGRARCIARSVDRVPTGPNQSLRWTRPLLITKGTRLSTVTSLSGSPSTAMRSARLPASMLPI